MFYFQPRTQILGYFQLFAKNIYFEYLLVSHSLDS